jgi:WD40 repeat protein
MSVEEALAIAAQLLPQQRLSKIEELVFRQTWDGQSYQEIAKVSGYGVGYIKDTGSKLWRSLSDALGVKVTKFNFRVVLQQQQAITPVPLPTADWGEAIDVSRFYDRSVELDCLSKWIVGDCSRLIGIVGMGGIGKTALSIKLAEQVQIDFERVIWRSLRDAPPFANLLTTLIRCLATPDTPMPDTDSGKLTQLLELLRQRRCLIVLDNFDALFQMRQRVGSYRDGYASYGNLIRRIGETRHRSCLVLTSREQPIELSLLQGEQSAVKSLPLTGLSETAAQKLLLDKNLCGTTGEMQTLADRYHGNPLALKIAAATISDIFAGQIPAFLQADIRVFEGIRQLLREQIDRLSDLENKLMIWLAINREPIGAIDLQADLFPPVPLVKIVETLESLKARSLVERSPTGFTQQPVIMEYLTERLIEQVCAELVQSQPQFTMLKGFALIKATAHDYIRASQERVILQPIVEQAITQLGSDRDLADQISHLLWQQRQQPQQAGYTVGNFVNLLCHLKIDLTGSDFSHLCVWQAYLADVALERVNFAYADLSKSVFAETFGGVSGVAFRPNGEQLATSDTSGEVQIWHIASGQQQIAFKADTVWTWAIAFHPDGNWLATGGDDDQVKLWDVATGNCVQTLSGHTSTINAIAFSPDGQILASCAQDATIRLWSMASFACEAILTDHAERVWSIAFSPDGQMLVSGSEDCTLKLWDVATRTCQHSIAAHSQWVKTVAFSPDGHSIASGSFDGTIKLWSVSSANCLHTLHGHRGVVTTVGFSPNGEQLASSSYDQTVKLWNVASGECLHSLQEHRNRVWSVAFSPDGHAIASGGDDHATRLWNLATGQCAKVWKGHTNGVLAIASRSVLLAVGHEDQIIRLWNVSSGQQVRSLAGHGDRIWSVAFHPNGQLLASGSADRTIKLWNVSNGQSLATLTGHTSWVWSVDFRSDGKQVASGSYDQTIRLWEVETGGCVQTLKGHTAPIVCVRYSPNGQHLASSSFDATIRIWDQTGACVQLIKGHSQSVWAIAWSPDGKQLASCSYDQTVKLWNVETGEYLHTFAEHLAPVVAIAFSPDGQQIASGSFDRTVKLWDVQTAQCQRTFYGHAGLISGVQFQAGVIAASEVLISSSFDETVRFWDITTGNLLQTIRTPRPYEGMNLTGATGISPAQTATLRALGAVERH